MYDSCHSEFITRPCAMDMIEKKFLSGRLQPSCSRRISLLLSLLIFFDSVSAKQDSTALTFEHATSGACNNTVFDALNATGSVQFTDLPALDNLTHTWTISTGISRLQYGPEAVTANSSQVAQTWWLNSEPAVSPNVTTLPYQGCLIALSGFKKTPILTTSVLTTSDDASTCAGVFDSTCYNDIIINLGWAAANVDASGDAQAACQTLASMSPPKSCKGMEWTSNATSRKYTHLSALLLLSIMM